MVTGLIPENMKQFNLFDDENPKHSGLMKTLDTVNAKMGSRMIRLASQAPKTWDMNQKMLSPRYTTSFSEILKIQCQ